MKRLPAATRAGFTLVELLIVIVLVGILATIVAPKFSATKESSFVAAMKSDLRNLAGAQERYFYDNADYYDGAVPAGALDFQTTESVTVTLESVSSSGWAATAVHIGTSRTCAIFYGDATPPAPAVVEGSPACD